MGSPGTDRTLVTDTEFIKLPMHVAAVNRSATSLDNFTLEELRDIEELNRISKKRNKKHHEELNYYSHADQIVEVQKIKRKPPRTDKIDRPGKKLYLCKNELKALPQPKPLQDEINEALGDGHKQII